MSCYQKVFLKIFLLWKNKQEKTRNRTSHEAVFYEESYYKYCHYLFKHVLKIHWKVHKVCDYTSMKKKHRLYMFEIYPFFIQATWIFLKVIFDLNESEI